MDALTRALRSEDDAEVRSEVESALADAGGTGAEHLLTDQRGGEGL